MFKTHYALVSALTSVTTLFLAWFVYTKGRDKRLNLLYAFWALCVGLWSFFLVLNIYAPTQALALVWCRLLHVWAILLPAVYVHFVLLFLYKYKSRRAWVWLLYLLAGIFIVLDFTPWFLSTSFRPQFDFFVTEPRLLYPLHVFIFVGSILYVYFELFQSVRESTGPKRKQIQYFLAASLVGYSGGVTNYLINYDYLIFPLYPFGNYTILAYVVVIGIAIVKYKLLDIEVIIKKTLVFAGLFSMAMALVAVMTTLSQRYLGEYLRFAPMVSTGLSVFLAILLYDPVKAALVHVTDRFLFQKKEDFRKILARLSEKIITILDLHQVARMILETFRESLRAETGVILLKNEEDYRILNSFGLVGPGGKGNYSANDPLIQYFRAHQEVLDLELEETYGRLPLLVSTALQKLGASVAIPLTLQKELIGLLTLGKKRSDQEYTQEEMDYFPTVAGQVAIALNNARLYHESIEARKKIEAMQLELIHREKMAFVADLVKGIAHEVFNPLLPIYHGIEDLEKDVFVALVEILESEEKKLAPDQRTKYLEALKELRSIAKSLKLHSHHIHLVIDTLNKMQKEDQKTIGPLDLKMFLKDSRALIGMELHREHHQVPVEEDVPRGLPPVKGNPTLLAQVFVNLFKNAIDAMDEVPEKKITIKARVDPEDPGFLKIDFADTGRGIPADILPRIFDFGFTTKGKKGQGIGLNQCKLIVENFGGRITCRSKPGEGTTFTLGLPLWQEKND